MLDVIDALIFISQRPIVIACALLGAGLVVAGSLVGVSQHPSRSDHASPQTWQPNSQTETSNDATDNANTWSQRLTRAGYAITFTSIALFIVAGFVSDLRP